MMRKVLFRKKQFGVLLLFSMLAVSMVSPCALAADSYNIGSAASTTSFSSNSDLTYNADGGTLTVNNDYNANSLTVNSDIRGTLDTSGGNNFTSSNTSISSGSTLTINGTGTIVLNDVALDGILTNNDENLNDLTSFTIDSGETGVVAGTQATKVTTANINGTHNYTANINTTYNTVNLAGLLNQNSSEVLTVDNLKVASGKTSAINLNVGSMLVVSAANSGILNMAIAAGATMNITDDADINELNLAGSFCTLSNQRIATLNIEDNATGVISGTPGSSKTITVTSANINGILNQTSSKIALKLTTLNVNSDRVKLTGTGAITVTNQVALANNLEIAGAGVKTFSNGVLINSGKTLTINDSAAHDLGAVTLAGTLTNTDANLSPINTLTIDSGSTGILSGTAATDVTTANIDGTNNYTITANTTYTTANIAGTLNQNSNNTLTLGTLNVANSDTATLNANAGSLKVNAINNSGSINAVVLSGATLDLGADAGISKLDLAGTLNSSSAHSINILNVAESTTGIFTGSGAATVTTVNLSSTLEQNSTGLLTISDLNAETDNAKLSGTKATTVMNQVVLTNNLEIDGTGVKTFSGGVLINSGKTLTINDSSAHNLGAVILAGTLTNNDAGLNAINTLTIESGSTGILSGSVATSVTTANINGTHNYTATFDSTYDTVNIAGILNQDSVNKLTMTNLNVSNGNTATMNVNAGILKVDAITNAGTMKFNIAKVGRLVNNNASAIDLSTNGSTLSLDFGDESNTGVYAKVSGKIMSAGTATDGTDTIISVYADNGVRDTTYVNVFDSALNDGTNDFDDGDRLNTNDVIRKYELVNNGTGVLVSIDNVGISSEIITNGGSAQTAGALIEIVENQGSMNAADNEYVSALTQLQGIALTRGTQQTIGQEATTGTAQAALQGVLGSTGAVSSQLTSFRSGAIAAGMTSFGSGGATAALADMADADTLAEAYDTGFTSASDNSVYKKVQVWANGYGSFGEQGSVDEMTGYDFHNIGTMVGFDYAFAEELRLGVLLGYSYNKTDVLQDFGASEDNVIRFGLYSSFGWDNFFADISSAMGIHLISSNRNIWNGSTANGKRTGIDVNVSGTVGYTFNLPADFQITPTYTLAYTMFNDPNYNETGAGSANVSYDSFTSNSLVQDLGIKAGKIFRTSDTLAFLPEVWGGWEVEYLNTGGTRNTVNVGQNFQTNMNGMATYRSYWGAGVTALLNDDISIYGRYDHKIWDSGYNIGFSAGIKIAF